MRDSLEREKEMLRHFDNLLLSVPASLSLSADMQRRRQHHYHPSTSAHTYSCKFFQTGYFGDTFGPIAADVLTLAATDLRFEALIQFWHGQ